MAFSSRMVASEAASMPGTGSQIATDRNSLDILRDYSLGSQGTTPRSLELSIGDYSRIGNKLRDCDLHLSPAVYKRNRCVRGRVGRDQCDRCRSLDERKGDGHSVLFLKSLRVVVID